MNESGFEYVFNESAATVARAEDVEQLYRSFRHHDSPFAFVHCGLRNEPDLEALGLAALVDARLLSEYLSLRKPKVGYEGCEELYREVDVVDSRHVLMSTLVFSHLKRLGGHVVELGGGFGNWARLNISPKHAQIYYRSWTIIDLPYVSALQRWYLGQLEIDSVRYVTTDEFSGWIDQDPPVDLVLAAHSLSELSRANFDLYLERLLSRATHLFYATHKRFPDAELVSYKLERLAERFNLITEVESEQGAVLNQLYVKKGA